MKTNLCLCVSAEDMVLAGYLVQWHRERVGYDPAPQILRIMFQAMKAGQLVTVNWSSYAVDANKGPDPHRGR